MTTTKTAPVAAVAADPKALAKAQRDAALKTAGKIAKIALAELPAHDFNTGSKGRTVRGNVTLDGVEYAVIVNVIDRATVTKKEAVSA